ncbi:MAG: transporter [Gemmatimonadota bacterium]
MRRPTLLRSACLVLAAGLPGAASGQEPARDETPPMVTDRPDFTESAVAVPPGRVQVESGYTWARSGDETTHEVGELLVRLGALRGVEARLGLSSLVVVDGPGPDRSGLADVSLGLKLDAAEILALAGELEIALIAGATLPTGSAATGGEAAVPGAVLALGHPLGGRVSAGLNAGWSREAEDGSRFHQGILSAAVGIELGSRWGAFLEAFALFPEGSRQDRVFLDGGATFLLRETLQLDVRAGTALDPDDPPELFAGLGVSFRFRI